MDKKTLLGALIVILVIVLCFAFSKTRAQYDYRKVLPGLWKGESEFLASAGLQDYYLYIAPDLQKGYLVILDQDDNLSSDQIVELRIRRQALRPEKLSVQITYSNLMPMPESVTFTLDVNQGTLHIAADGEMYAFLIKDNESSLVANAEYAEDE